MNDHRAALGSALAPSATLPRQPVISEVVAGLEPPEHWLREVQERWPVRIHLVACRPAGRASDGLLQLVEIHGTGPDVSEVGRYLQRRSDLREVSVLPLGRGRSYARVVGPLPRPCRGVFEHGVTCSTCLLLGRSGAEGGWRLAWPGTAAELGSFLRRAAGPGSRRVPIRLLRRFRPIGELTARQAIAVETAFRLGYYAFPRRAQLGTVATTLRVGRSTAAELLRRAEAKLLATSLRSSEAGGLQPVDDA